MLKRQILHIEKNVAEIREKIQHEKNEQELLKLEIKDHKLLVKRSKLKANPSYYENIE
jgi:cell division protein FtsL